MSTSTCEISPLPYTSSDITKSFLSKWCESCACGLKRVSIRRRLLRKVVDARSLSLVEYERPGGLICRANLEVGPVCGGWIEARLVQNLPETVCTHWDLLTHVNTHWREATPMQNLSLNGLHRL